MLISTTGPLSNGRVSTNNLAGETRQAPQPAVANGNAGAVVNSDQLNLTQKSQARNPYEGVAPSFNSVSVDAWGKGKNSSVESMLLGQGYTHHEIYSKGANGKTLLDEVGRVNNLRNINLIRPGQSLIVPSKEQAQAPAQQAPAQQAPAQQAPAAKPAAPQAQPQAQAPAAKPQTPAAQPKVENVKVDAWGQGPDSSLSAIMMNRGFKKNDLFREDANGDSIIKQVARANGLSDPSKIQAGQTLRVPNSRDALSQMNIPAQQAPRQQAPAQQAPAQQAPAQKPAAQQPPVQAPPVQKPAADNGQQDSEITANMGLLLDGVKDGKFTRDEFSYLNARSSRYAQMRARFSKDGYTNDELRELGKMERRYGVEFARLAATDSVKLPTFPATTNDPDLAVQVKTYQESGPLYDQYKNGTATTESALSIMVRQRAEARRQEVR